MKTIPVILCVALLLMCACMPKIPSQTQPAAPVQTQPEPQAQPAAPAQTQPVQPAQPVAPPAPATPTEMDAATLARLNTAFGPGIRLAFSDAIAHVKIGQPRVIGIGLRSLVQGQDTFQIRFELKNSYDKSMSIITSDFNQVKPWIVSNLGDAAHDGMARIELNAKGEERYNFLISVDPTLTDGTPTTPGTYELKVTAYQLANHATMNQVYESKILTLIVEQ